MQNKYHVHYQAATHSWVITIRAENVEQAIALVRERIRKQIALPSYQERYEIISVSESL